MLKAIKHNSNFLQYASDKIKSNKDIATILITNHSEQQQQQQQNESSYSIEDDIEVVDAFMYISFELRNDYEFMNKMIKINPLIYFDLSDNLKNNLNFIYRNINYLCRYKIIHHIPKIFWNDYDVALNYVKNHWSNLYYVSNRLKFHPEFLIEAISQTRQTIETINWNNSNFFPFYYYIFNLVKLYEVSLSVFIHTILCSSSSSSKGGEVGVGAGEEGREEAYTSKSLNKISHLKKLSLLGSFAGSDIKKHIAEYAGVQIGIRWKKLSNTFRRISNLFIRFEKERYSHEVLKAWRNYSIQGRIEPTTSS
mmetsp:Transcript_39765/g.51262  ORF Transcript_39765/g.51262 Transcript_39765/m.51262 type:complete len:309 (+) Transcript_39765:344-1270(+)